MLRVNAKYFTFFPQTTKNHHIKVKQYACKGNDCFKVFYFFIFIYCDRLVYKFRKIDY